MNGEPIRLSNGVVMPPIVMSTFGMGHDQMKAMILAGLDAGYRAFDTARQYGNEDVVGQVIKECLSERGLNREDVFLTTKMHIFQQEEGDIERQFEISLRNLQSNYIDLWLIHWPAPDYYLETWKKMCAIYKTGRIRSIGIANPQIRHIKAIENLGLDTPIHCVQFELHPLRTCDELVDYCHAKDIAVQAYTPFCKMIPAILNNATLQSIAINKGRTIAQIILRWHYQRKQVPVFASKKPSRALENIGIFDFQLLPEEMAAIEAQNQNYKLLPESIYCPGY